MKFAIRVVALVTIFSFPQYGYAGPEEDYKEGFASYKDGDVFTAMPKLEAASNAGHIEATLLLAYIYDKAQENETAVKLYRYAAEKGDPKGQLEFGLMVVYGEGITKDVAVGRSWVEKSVQQNYTQAMLVLGQVYIKGQWGFDVDRDRGMTLIRKAAELGDPDASDYVKSMESSTPASANK